MSRDAIEGRFNSLLKTSEKGYGSLRCKMEFTGRNGVRCWSPQLSRTELPEDWTAQPIKPRLHFKGLWMMPKEFGLLCEMTDAMITEVSTQCPFEA